MTPTPQLLQLQVQEKPRLSTQCARLLRLLESKWCVGSAMWPEGYDWISLPEILNLRPRIASHTKIISNLREKGCVIECEMTTVIEEDGHGNEFTEMHTRYRLVSKPDF